MCAEDSQTARVHVIWWFGFSFDGVHRAVCRAHVHDAQPRLRWTTDLRLCDDCLKRLASGEDL